MGDDFHIPRPEQALALAAALSPDPVFGDRAGQFLAAPRRTGKSTFLRRELIPLVTGRGQHAVYVDLWADRDADPAQLMAHALADDLRRLASLTERVMGALPFRAISVGGVSVELAPGSVQRTGTLTDALMEIGRRAGKDVVFIVDEAQHALNSARGLDAMFALKAARDAMNQRPEGARLYLVFTGSHRDKLAALVLDHRAPFFGATIRDFPRLGRAYTDALVARINPRLAQDNQLDPGDVARAFELLGHRPEKLTEVIREHALGEPGSAGLRQTVTARADALRARVWAQFDSDFGALGSLQRALLRVLVEDGAAFAPFASPTLARLGAILGRVPGTSEVQKALDALREAGIVWRPARGSYALEDQDMRDWLMRPA
ncbi:MAG: hypothetical protein KDK26_10715 [Roseivivax sp.]|nr:hypothetical protein [Roseivivax sp.]